MTDIHVAVLAAGKGTRMKSAIPKVLHRAAGEALIEHVLRAADALRPKTITVIVGHMADAVKAGLSKRMGLAFALQEPQLGTGHALMQVEPHLRDASGTLVLLSGDVPLLKAATLRRLVERHQQTAAAATVLTARVSQPQGYGRIVRDRDGAIAAIVEEKDATADERAIDEINSGVYAFDLGPLFEALQSVGAANAQGEYYLPDLVRIYRGRGMRVETVVVADAREVLGVNSRKELTDVTAIMKADRIDALMADGVTVVDPASTWIGPDVVIGADTVLHPSVFLEGRTRIGRGCVINSGVRIVDSVLDDEVVVNNFCVISESHIATGAQVGPFAHIRPLSEIGEGARIGNFVELKKTAFGKGSKANHLAYLGDSTVGQNVNIGAGTITCNYDGTAKHATVIEDGAFIGSDSQLVAPVRVGKGAYVAAGSSIVEDVPDGALGIARGRQTNKPGWAAKKKKQK